MRTLALLLAATLCLAGCDRLKAAFTPIPEKVNAAFPLPDEVEIARSRLLAGVEGDKAAHEAMSTQFAQLMNARALACTAAAAVGRFDTPARIRAKVADTQCFTAQDAQLEEWIAVRRIGLALRAPALVAATPLPARAVLPNTVDSFSSAQLAAQANVLVLRGAQQKVQALQLPSGKEISSFSVDGYGRPSVSPNGRLVAVPGVKMLRVVDVESGRPLWTTDKYQDLVAWSPQWEGVVLAQAGTGAPYLLDTRSGRIEAYPSAEKRLTWSLPRAAGQLLVGNNTSASLMQHTRLANGTLEVQAVRQWTLANGLSGNAPFLMQQGQRLVFPTYRELAWIDLESGERGSWQLSALNATGYAQLAEDIVAFDVPATDGTTATTRLLDTGKGTIATVREVSDRGQVFPLAPRAGLLRRGANAVTLVGALQGEDPQDAQRLIAEALTAREIAKLNDPYRPDFAVPAPARSPEQQAYIDALSKQVRAMNTQAAIRDGLPRETVEAIRRGELPRLSGGTPAPALPGVATTLPRGKTILDVPADARVAIVGVYQPRGRSINVSVAPGSTPIVLVLTSYEAVEWVIQPGSRKIAAVLLSGYKPSTVSGQGGAQVVRIGSMYAYKIGSSGFEELRREVARYAGPNTPVFQGLYEGSQFQVQ